MSVGTNTASTGTDGRYFATSRAVDPPCVRTTMSAARTYCEVQPNVICLVIKRIVNPRPRLHPRPRTLHPVPAYPLFE